MADPIIKVNDVSKSYGGVKANIDISMTVERGSITGIIGPNGCGKTTLFNSIVGYHPIDSGSIQFDNTEISKLRVGDIARMECCGLFSKPVYMGKWTVLIICKFRYLSEKVQRMQCLLPAKVKFVHELNTYLNLWGFTRNGT